jgi:hypothetical protein
MKNRFLILTLVAASAAAGAQADTALRQGFAADVTRTGVDGRGFSRHTEQLRTPAGFTRQSTLTTTAGKSAQRAVVVNNDAAAQARTRAVEGTRLNGNAYSGQAVTTRTGDGYVRSGTYTNAAGETATRDVSVSVDAEAQSLTKTRSVTGFNGETRSSTTVRTRTGGGE